MGLVEHIWTAENLPGAHTGEVGLAQESWEGDIKQVSLSPRCEEPILGPQWSLQLPRGLAGKFTPLKKKFLLPDYLKICGIYLS